MDAKRAQRPPADAAANLGCISAVILDVSIFQPKSPGAVAVPADWTWGNPRRPGALLAARRGGDAAPALPGPRARRCRARGTKPLGRQGERPAAAALGSGRPRHGAAGQQAGRRRRLPEPRRTPFGKSAKFRPADAVRYPGNMPVSTGVMCPAVAKLLARSCHGTVWRPRAKLSVLPPDVERAGAQGLAESSTPSLLSLKSPPAAAVLADWSWGSSQNGPSATVCAQPAAGSLRKAPRPCRKPAGFRPAEGDPLPPAWRS